MADFSSNPSLPEPAMIAFELVTQRDTPSPAAMPVTVIGVGGAGANILDTIALEGLAGAQLVVLNTDGRALQSSLSSGKIHIGKELTRGLGAGGDPELGREAARGSEEEIRAEVRGQKMIFLCVGLGGGTGSGAAPYIAQIAKEEGAFVVAFAVMPFAFEGKRRVNQARESLEILRAVVDALITFDNDRLGEVVLPKKGIHEAFEAADKIVSQSIRAIINLVSQPGLIRIGMDELIAALGEGDRRCLFGYGAAQGENRVAEALLLALKSPLLHKGELRERGRQVLVHVSGGPQMTFAEVQELMQDLGTHLHEETQILFGTGVDAKMGELISVTLIASLSETATPSEEPVVSDSALVDPPQPAMAAEVLLDQSLLLLAPASEATSLGKSMVTETTTHELAAEFMKWEAPAQCSFPPASLTPMREELAEVIGPFANEEFVSVEEPRPTSIFAEPLLQEPVCETVSEPVAEVVTYHHAVYEEPLAMVEAPCVVRDEEPVTMEAPMPQFMEAEPSEEMLPSAEVWLDPEYSAAAVVEPAIEELPEPPVYVAPPAPAGPVPVVPPAASPFRRFGSGADRKTGKSVFFQSWARAEEQRSSVEYEAVGGVSDFGDEPEPAPVPTPKARPERPAQTGRLSLFFSKNKASEEPAKAPAEQATFDESLQKVARGRFEKASPTIENGEDLDVPTFMRRRPGR